MTGKRSRLAQRRRAVGYSQEAFAEVLGVDRSTVARWERGETEPQPYVCPKLARVLGVTVDELTKLLAPTPTVVALPATYAAAPHRPHVPYGAQADEDDDMNRRELLQLLAVAGAHSARCCRHTARARVRRRICAAQRSPVAGIRAVEVQACRLSVSPAATRRADGRAGAPTRHHNA